jgi:urease
MFVSQASIDNGVVQSYGLRKRVEAVKGCRTVGKKDMKFNDAMPKMKVDPESYVSWNPLFFRQGYANLWIILDRRG